MKRQYFVIIVLITIPFAQLLDAAKPSGGKAAARREATYQRQINNRQKRVAYQQKLMDRKVGNTARRQKIVARHEKQISHLNNLKKVASSPSAIRATKRAAVSKNREQAKSQRQSTMGQAVAQNSRRGRGQSASSGNSSKSEPRTTSRTPRGNRSRATRSGGNRSSSNRSVSRGNRSSGNQSVGRGSKSPGKRSVRRGSHGGNTTFVSRPRNSGKKTIRYARGRGSGRSSKPAARRGSARPAPKRGRSAHSFGPRRSSGRYGSSYARSRPSRSYSRSRHGSSYRYRSPYYSSYYRRHNSPYRYRYYDSSFLRMYYGDFDFYFGVHRPSYSWYRYNYGGYYPQQCIYVYGAASPTVIREYVVVSEPEVAVVQPESEAYTTHGKLMGQLLFEQDEKRLQAATELGEYKDISTVAALSDVLINDANYQVRAAAAQSLGQIEDSASYEVLLRSADAEQSETVQKAAVAAVENIEQANDEDELYVSPKFPPMNNGKEKLGTYMEQLRFGSDDQRKKAAKKLEDYPGTQAVTALTNALINDPDKSVRKEAANSLGEIGDRMPLPFLGAASVNDPEKSVRKEAEDAIEEIHETIL